jgi:hypothetical protein
VANIVLGLQGGVADGSEPTFDGQPMQPGVHLRWGFAPELGFPPGGFWLCRRIAKDDEKRIPPPPAIQKAIDQQTNPTVFSPLPADNQWQAVLREPCESVTVAGCAARGCDEVVIETFGKNSDGEMVVTSRQVIPVEQGAFRVGIAAREISCVRVVGAGSMEECGRGEVLPPCDCGPGDGGNGGGDGPPDGGKPGWGPPGENGWSCWGVPFTLPVTWKSWPARYFGAPDPLTTPLPQMLLKDVEEATRRLGTSRLAAGMTPAEQRHHLATLHAELVRLVEGFASTLLPDVPLQDSPAGANAPRLNISLMEELLLLALDPYFARVLGLYFVDEDAQPGVKYDYVITGYWGGTPMQGKVLFPGLTPGAPLARGKAVFNGMTIQPLGGTTSLWRWTRDDVNGNYRPVTDPSAPFAVEPAVSAALAGLGQAQQPDALLAVLSTIPGAFWITTPPPQVSIALVQPAAQIFISLSGIGSVTAYSSGAPVASVNFNNGQLATLTVASPDPATAIDEIRIVGVAANSVAGIVVVVGQLTLYRLSPIAIGTRYALLPPPGKLVPLPPPGQPISTFRHRKADVDPATLRLVPHSLIDVEWPAPAALPGQLTGDPVSNPIALPPPTQPIGFVLQQHDTGKANSAHLVPRWIAAASSPTPSWSKITTPRLHRYSANVLVDPEGGWSHRVSGFDAFGAIGHWSGWTAAMGVEKIAAAPTGLRITQFDNRASSGGAAAPDGSEWKGGSLNFAVDWSGASFMMYPDIATARVTVQSVDIVTGTTGPLSSLDIDLPDRKAQQLTIASVSPTPLSDGLVQVDIQTVPPLTPLGVRDPAAMLLLTLSDGTSENYVVRPIMPVSPGPVLVRLQAGPSARIVAQGPAFVGQTAYLVPGYSTQLTLAVPLTVPLDQTSAKGQVFVTGSTKTPFDSNEKIIDPNGVNAPRDEPQSVALSFTGSQRLVPPTPPTPEHIVDHLYYDPADYTGRAGKTLPFVTGAAAGVAGYVLQRSPIQSLMIADIKRRIKVGNAADPTPVVLDGGAPRQDLVSWIAALNQWIGNYNALQHTALTAANLLEDAAGQRAFMEHFYRGLLDDELRALADLPANAVGYARVNPTPMPPGTTVSDTVDGTGYGRTVYRLAAVNAAGSNSGVTGAIGPYYTQIVTPPRPPVLYKVQPQDTSIIVAWSLDTNPDVAAYLVYRGGDSSALDDLRFFGPDAANPSDPSLLATINYNPLVGRSLTFGVGLIDPRIIGLVPDPRLCARDHQGSDMGEIALPVGPPPDAVNGIYRLSEFQASAPPLAQPAFNYWTPPGAGIAQIVTDSPTQTRLTGLRIGLGRGVPVVVVATWQGQVKVVGSVPLRRAGFIDGVNAGGSPLDPNSLPGIAPPSVNLPNSYAVVAVDIFGNRSSPSKVFAARMLALEPA